jgi:hypothetical protein
MDWLTEPPTYTYVGPQLTGVKILEICAGVLLLLTLLTFIIGWAWHFSGRVRLYVLVPLAAGITAGMTAHILHTTYVYWVFRVANLPPSFPREVGDNLMNGIANANQAATALGWVFVIVTGMVLALSLVGLWRLRRKAGA